jgi:cytochrome P450
MLCNEIQFHCWKIRFCKYSSCLQGLTFQDPDQQKFIAGTVVEAGSDTTRNQNNLMVAAAATDPSWVDRVRKELDAVCGHNAERLPNYDDIEKLPIIQAVIKETMRWRPNITEPGFPHALTEDLEFEGYRFEKGTIFTWNSWHISTASNEYEDPLAFKPERYMNEHVWDTLEGNWGFGAGMFSLLVDHSNVLGRRVCVGWHVAARNMFFVFARLLYCFDFIEDPVTANCQPV